MDPPLLDWSDELLLRPDDCRLDESRSDPPDREDPLALLVSRESISESSFMSRFALLDLGDGELPDRVLSPKPESAPYPPSRELSEDCLDDAFRASSLVPWEPPMLSSLSRPEPEDAFRSELEFEAEFLSLRFSSSFSLLLFLELLWLLLFREAICIPLR